LHEIALDNFLNYLIVNVLFTINAKNLPTTAKMLRVL